MPSIAFPSDTLPPDVVRDQAIRHDQKQFFDRLQLFRPATLKILMVTDGTGSFDHTNPFGLGRAIDVLTADP
jgi:hypothetical protein